MKNLLTNLLVALVSTFTFAQDYVISSSSEQFEVGLKYGSYAAVSDFTESTFSSAVPFVGYDFIESNLKAELFVDVWTDGGLQLMPGIQLGHDNIFLITQYDTDFESFLFGIGGKVDVGNFAISASLAGGATTLFYDVYTPYYGTQTYYSDLGLGYATLGVAYKF